MIIKPHGWVVSQDKKVAIVAHYKTLNEVNAPYRRLKLRGLDSDKLYNVEQNSLRSGAELMKAGLICSDASSGQINDQNQHPETFDFDSKIWVITQVEK